VRACADYHLCASKLLLLTSRIESRICQLEASLQISSARVTDLEQGSCLQDLWSAVGWKRMHAYAHVQAMHASALIKAYKHIHSPSHPYGTVATQPQSSLRQRKAATTS
jgi:hypothetical protein